MPVRKYTDLLNFNLNRPQLPEAPKLANIGDFLSTAAKGGMDALDFYQSSVAKRIQREMEEERMKREREENEVKKQARDGRSKFRQELIDGKQVPVMEEVPGWASAHQGQQKQTGMKRENLNEKDMVDSYLRNVPLEDDSDAKGLMGLLIDKNKPSAVKMKELTDNWDVELSKSIDNYKQQNGGKYPPKDIQEQMAFEIGGTPYAKIVKQGSSMNTTWDTKKHDDNQEQREIGNSLAEQRIALGRQNFDLSVGKDFRSDQQEYGKKLVDLQTVETHLAPVERKIQDGKLNFLSSKVFSNNWGQIAQNLQNEDPELAAELGYLAAAYIKMISGAAVAESEAVRLLGTVGVNVWSTPEKLKAGVQGMRNEINAKRDILDSSYDRVREHYKGKGKEPGSPTPAPTAPKKRSADDYLKELELGF